MDNSKQNSDTQQSIQVSPVEQHAVTGTKPSALPLSKGRAGAMKRILLVEESADDVEMIREAFQQADAGVELTVAGDGQEALEHLQQSLSGAYSPSVVLMSLNLPKIHGLEVLKRIKSDPELRSIPVVMLSPSLEADELRQSYTLGANSCVVKPMTSEDYKKTLQRLSHFWIGINQLSA